jgi:5-formyltetrahydrofolate cyclo-ligase
MKGTIRKEILEKRKNLNREDLAKKSQCIKDHILSWDEYKRSDKIMVYYSFRNEVLTNEIIESSFGRGKEVILPKSIKETREILPCKIASLDELVEGNYGIMEPPEKEIISRDEIDIVFVPGAAFDKKGFRIGYGAGYYDRFLDGYKGIKVGVCFNLQIVEDAYPDRHDISMDYLVTEKGIIKTGD